MALMIGAMTIHNIQPGPQVMANHPELFWALIVSMWIGNLMLVILNLPLIGLWIKLLKVPYRVLFPAITLFCVIGVYSLNYNVFDIYMMAIFGSMCLAAIYPDLPFGDFITTIPNAVTWRSLLVGIVQAPVFAIVITLVGCYQGFQVQGGADSVGQQTTKAVVQSIFYVIVIVALFSILMRNVGL